MKALAVDCLIERGLHPLGVWVIFPTTTPFDQEQWLRPHSPKYTSFTDIIQWASVGIGAQFLDSYAPTRDPVILGGRRPKDYTALPCFCRTDGKFLIGDVYIHLGSSHVLSEISSFEHFVVGVPYMQNTT